MKYLKLFNEMSEYELFKTGEKFLSPKRKFD